MHTEILSYDADGLTMESHLYVDDRHGAGRRPAVLVFPEAFGLGDHAKSRAVRLAGLGYTVLACDIHGHGKLYTELAEVMPIVTALRDNPLKIRARAQAALQTLLNRPEVDPTRIAAIGYCFGGTMSLELARGGADIRAAVGFHSGLTTKRPDDAKQIKAKVLACIGADDPGITPADRAAFEQEMRAGGVDWQLHLYGGVVHSFTNKEAAKMGMPDFARYDAAADVRSWEAMIGLFAEVLA